jgi:hypothetical protein
MENLDSSFDDPVRIQDRYSDGAPRKLRKSRAKGSRTCLDFEISHLEADYEIGMVTIYNSGRLRFHSPAFRLICR